MKTQSHVMQHSFPPVDGVTHRFVKANGLNLHLAEAGSGEPLLLLHGWPQRISFIIPRMPNPILTTAIARRAGAILNDTNGTRRAQIKQTAIDLVPEYDCRSEAYIVSA